MAQPRQSICDQSDLNICGMSKIQHLIVCDEVISSDVKKISQMFLEDGSEELMW